RSLGHHGLRARAPAQPERHAGGRLGSHPSAPARGGEEVSQTLATALARIQRAAFTVGAAGAVLSVLGLVLDRQRFFQAYLTGYLFVLGPALGSLAIVMLHNMTGGAWGFAVKRLL